MRAVLDLPFNARLKGRFGDLADLSSENDQALA
jgi:hypothetical protein